MMSKKKQVAASMLKELGKKMAAGAYNSASIHYCYQPEEPKGLEKFVKANKR